MIVKLTQWRKNKNDDTLAEYDFKKRKKKKKSGLLVYPER